MMTFADKNSWIHIIHPLNSYYQPRCDDIYVTSTNTSIVYCSNQDILYTGIPYKQAPYYNENKQFRIGIKICKEALWIIYINDPFV